MFVDARVILPDHAGTAFMFHTSAWTNEAIALVQTPDHCWPRV